MVLVLSRLFVRLHHDTTDDYPTFRLSYLHRRPPDRDKKDGGIMLTKEENEFLTRVGPGTPGGELLRRYWHPVAVAQELTPEQPTRFVRLLGENLVLFRDKLGRLG